MEQEQFQRLINLLKMLGDMERSGRSMKEVIAKLIDNNIDELDDRQKGELMANFLKYMSAERKPPLQTEEEQYNERIKSYIRGR